jgi:hypothetical protein
MAKVGPLEFPEMKASLTYPWMRDELVRHLRELADEPRQREHWTPDETRSDYIVHFLFDDTPEPANAVGYYLHDEPERAAVLAVTSAIDAVLAKYGTSLEDREYVAKPEWAHVVEAAAKALTTVGEQA